MAARLSRLISAAAHFGVTISKPGKGSHWKATKPGCRPYPVPAHNGEKTEIADKYIRGLCRAFEIELVDFEEKL